MLQFKISAANLTPELLMASKFYIFLYKSHVLSSYLTENGPFAL